jgi:hypothetical protein
LPLIAAEAPALRLTIRAQWVLFILLSLWSLAFLVDPRHPDTAGVALFHLVNLPFVLGGKVLVSHLGSFGLALLAPELGGLLAPLLVIGWYLVAGNRLGALVGLGWLGASCIDATNYLDDLHGQFHGLLEGCGAYSPSANWEFHLVARQQALQRDASTLGSLFLIAALVLAGLQLWQHRR